MIYLGLLCFKLADALFGLPLTNIYDVKGIAKFIKFIKKFLKMNENEELGSFENLIIKMLISKFEYDGENQIDFVNCVNLWNAWQQTQGIGHVN